MVDFWSLPGPENVLEEARRALESNSHVVFVRSSEQGYPDPRSIVRNFSPYFREVVVPEGTDLLDALAEAFDYPAGQPVNLHKLWAYHPPGKAGLAGSLVWVHGVRARDFQTVAVELSAINATAQPYEHAGLCTVVTEWTEPGHVAIRTIVCEEAIGLLDVQLFAARALRDRVSPRQLSFVSLLVAQLALYDLRLVPRLAALPLEELLEPTKFFREVAFERDWCANHVPHKADGSLGLLDGKVRLHSARKVLGSSLDRRVWRAQIAALLPTLEEVRQKLVLEHESHILPYLPITREYRNRHVIVSSLEDVEFADLVGLASKYPSRWPSDVTADLRELANCRNDLAHLQALRWDMVERLLIG